MSTTLELPPAPLSESVSRRPFLARVAEWTRVGTPAAALEPAQSVRAGAPAVLLSLVFAVCAAIYGMKFAIGLKCLWWGGEKNPGSGMPLAIFNWDLPLWKTLTLGAARVWLCCTEDFLIGLSILLLGMLALKVLSLRALTRRLPRLSMAARWAFWGFVYIASAAALAIMAAEMFNFFTQDRFFDKKSFDKAGNLFRLEKSVQDEVTVMRQLIILGLSVGVIAVQLLLVRLLPRFWRRAAYYLCRPLPIMAGIGAFILLNSFGIRAQAFDLSQEFQATYGSFTHNAHAHLVNTYLQEWLNDWGIEYVGIGEHEVPDFFPGYPGIGKDSNLAKLDKDKRPKNIIFIVIESGGSEWMHAYGAPWANTPNIEKIVLEDKNGILCENTYAISDHTIASAIALFGSMNNHDCENCAVYAARDYPGPNKNFPVPAVSTWLQKKGYRTYFCGAGGKDVWQGYKNLGEAFLPYGFDIAKDGYRHWGKEEPDWGFKEGKHDDVSLFDDAYRCMDDAKKKDKPFFLMMWNYDTHWKYTDGDGPKEAFDESKFPPMVQKDPERMAQFRRYLKSIWRFDRLVDKLYKDLDKRGLADDTLLVITGDHGQSFGHHGIWTHGYKLYEEEVRVPLIFINKNLGEFAADNKCGPRNKLLCSHLDIWPTVMDVCDLDCNKKWQGKSLFTKTLDPKDRHAYLWVGGLASIREGQYKYIWDKEDHELYLFNIDDDPEEQNNLLKQNPAKFNPIKNQLHNQLHKWMTWQAEYNDDMLKNGKRD